MKKLQKLINNNESNVTVISPISDEEIRNRQIDYPVLGEVEFAKKYRALLFKEVELVIGCKSTKIQSNFCINPFCKWFGLPQHKYNNVKNKPSRYKLVGEKNLKRINCNEVSTKEIDGIVIKNYVTPLSNWSVALEIKRLIDIYTVSPIESPYSFHKEGCDTPEVNPIDNPKEFYKKGKSSSNSQKYKCKSCGKMTNVLPNQRECFTYHQQRDDILPRFALQVVSRTPVTRTVELLGIGVSTYYKKLEQLYQRCLEFLDKHETKKLSKMHFNELWLTTDKFSYSLNNIRKKGHGKDYSTQERPLFLTYIVVTVDSDSRYAFRTDLAFDYNVTADDIESDIEIFKDNHVYNFAQKNAKYRYSYYGATTDDTTVKENEIDNYIDQRSLHLRKDYIDGFHVNTTYTSYAHFWLIRNILNVDKINYVSDEDNSIITALMRVFSNEIKNGAANIFTCRIDKSLKKKEAYLCYKEASERLHDWKDSSGLKCSMREAAISKLASDLETHKLYGIKTVGDKSYPYYLHNPIEHPYPNKDEGIRYVDCITNLSQLSTQNLAEVLYKVNMRAVNTYFNQIRRRASILERPLVSGRGEGKSFIYSNFNPKYANYILTILRTYLNFCDTFKYKKEYVTPAMLLGLTDRAFTFDDIIYLK